MITKARGYQGPKNAGRKFNKRRINKEMQRNKRFFIVNKRIFKIKATIKLMVSILKQTLAKLKIKKHL